MHEVNKSLETQPEPANLEHHRMVGVVERYHSTFRRVVKLNSIGQWKDCFKYF